MKIAIKLFLCRNGIIQITLAHDFVLSSSVINRAIKTAFLNYTKRYKVLFLYTGEMILPRGYLKKTTF